MKKYGLQLRVPPPPKTSKPLPPRPPPAFAFGGDDEDDVEREISRQATKNKALQKIEEQHKKAIEEDPSVFDYDGVYDEMKEKIARPKIQDKTERKSKYIETLMEKAKQREREHEVVYERKLLKERSKEDHLFADKEKFVTSAYKKKLAEQAKWLEEERLRKIREEKEDVTKKSDLSDFYFGLSQNVAFGAQSQETANLKQQKWAEDTPSEAKRGNAEMDARIDDSQNRGDTALAETSSHGKNDIDQDAEVIKSDVVVNHDSGKENGEGEQSAATATAETTNEQYKRSDDALAAARARFLSRKRAREQI
ncbi:hypothetical protein Cni_G20632 [Canna indica]|uniref:Nuclear speckle splicing regulatory protein 1 N-terminal domain-containing protein n=1 Tax=Canna indica TaxID=4628 RepID=A0AAQ3KMZ6_9LILI|nr:hypothetical protein Cni_G20632 [Canna indica]